MSLDDLPALIDLQQAGAVVGMADVFPQDQHPFPRDAILDRWRAEIADPTVICFVAIDDNRPSSLDSLRRPAASCSTSALRSEPG